MKSSFRYTSFSGEFRMKNETGSRPEKPKRRQDIQQRKPHDVNLNAFVAYVFRYSRIHFKSKVSRFSLPVLRLTTRNRTYSSSYTTAFPTQTALYTDRKIVISRLD